MKFYSAKLDEIKKELQTDLENGLTAEEVQQRLEEHGKNSLPEKKPPSALQTFLEQLKSPLVYVLLFALVVSLLIAHWEDGIVIAAALLVNTFLGFFQERRALNILEELKKLVHPEAKVIREGRERLIGAEELVPGDIIVLDPGDKVPADARLITENDLRVVEAALTGESVPSEKNIAVFPEDTSMADRENMVFLGTVVSRGRAKAVVVATGEDTELGKIALLVTETEDEKTPLQQQLSRFSILLSRLVLIICLLILVIGVAQSRGFFEMLSTAVAIAVSAIPEGLLVALTVVLALGMQRILREKGLVRRLIAAETLGSTSVICTDKTGTLTEGKMRVAHIHSGGIEDEEEINRRSHGLALKIGALCNNVVVENLEEELAEWKMIGDSTEQALLQAAAQGGFKIEALRETYPRLAELPFNEDRKFMATLHQDTRESQKKLMVKGAPELILERSEKVMVGDEMKPLTSTEREKIMAVFKELSGRGLRVLGVGYKVWDRKGNDVGEDDVAGLVYVASVSLKDPLRDGVQNTIALCRQAGIRPILVTGDFLLTARAIAEEAGITLSEENMIEGSDLDGMSDEELQENIERYDLYARVTPEHKMRIIRAWQKENEVVAMTGDGVNDAPALKKADIGVALGSGTEVAKEAADLVLLDDRFATIVAAVKQGRIIFDNLRKIITYLMADAFSEVVLITGGLLLNMPLPILSAQILWINLITDGFPHLALTVEPQERDVMQHPPREKGTEVVNREMKVIIFAIGLFTDAIILALYLYLFDRLGVENLTFIRTVVFAALGIDSLFYVFACKSLRRPIWQTNPLSNRWLLLAIGGGWLLQLLAIYWAPLQNLLRTTALPWNYWVLLIGLAVFKLAGIELVKSLFTREQESWQMA